MACSVEPNHHSCEYYFWVIEAHTALSVGVFSGSEDALPLESAQNYANSFFYCNYYKEIFVCFKELLYELELFILISRKEDCCHCWIFVLRIAQCPPLMGNTTFLGWVLSWAMWWPEELPETVSSSLHASHQLTLWGECLLEICISVKLQKSLTQFTFAEDNCLLCPSSWLACHPAFFWIPLRLTLPCPALHHLSHFIPPSACLFQLSPHKFWLFLRPQIHLGFCSVYAAVFMVTSKVCLTASKGQGEH